MSNPVSHLIHEGFTIPWTRSHVSIVYGYLLKLGSNFNSSDFAAVSYVRHHCPCNDAKFAERIESHTEGIQELLAVPKFRRLHHKKNEILGAFISFLLQLLDHEIDVSHSFGGRIQVLKKELRFLVTVLGEKVLQSDEIEQVQNLLAEFEAVANEAGRLVCSFIFSTDGVFIATGMEDALVAVFKHIESLKDNISSSFLLVLPNICEANISQNTADVDSAFIVDSLINDLEDLMNREGDRFVDVKGQIKILHRELIHSQLLLNDIKSPQDSEIDEIEELVIQFRDEAFAAEYVINSFMVGHAPLWYLIVRLTAVIHKIKCTGTRFEEIKKNYKSGASEVAKDPREQLSLRSNRYSEVDGIAVGFEDKTVYILEQLVGGTEHLQIISIFGMAGIGKTTLARELYNHPTVNYYFDKCSWCVVSQTYERRSLLIDILISFQCELDNDMKEDILLERIYRSLKGRRYLIVMDDIWDSNVWFGLQRCFPDDRNGSRILFTTRNKDVAPPNSISYSVPSLSNDQSWELLEKKVFYDKPCPPQLVGIGQKIAANCYGLPLAVVVIAGVLSSMEKEKKIWETVGESLKTYIFSDQNDAVMQILKLSYKHLPQHLKPCFLYFGAFREDKEIPIKKLKWLWIAEGIVSKGKNKRVESIAEEYLMELIDKSLIIVSKRRSDGGVKTCVIHDLLRDLCLRIAEEENFLRLFDDNCKIYTKDRRLSLHTIPLLDVPHKYLLPFGFHVCSIFGSHSVFDSSAFVSNFKLLRVLDLPGSKLSHGDGIEHLVHLRYLAAYFIPASIRGLVNLEFLIMVAIAGGAVSIFSIIPELVKLRYLKAPLENLDNDCDSSQTNNLEFLSSVFIKNLKDEEILKCSPHLRKLKCKCAPFVDEQGVYRFLDLHFLTELESLNMSTSLHILTELESLNMSTSLHKKAELNLPLNIRKLTLSGFRLPWEKMSIIEVLPNLQVLKLRSNAFVGEKWDTKDGKFQELVLLKLECLDIVEWNVESNEHFPKLSRLVLRDCQNLQEIPCEIGDIATLQLIEVVSCSKTVVESAREIQQEQVDMGNEELQIIIQDVLENKSVRTFHVSPDSFPQAVKKLTGLASGKEVDSRMTDEPRGSQIRRKMGHKRRWIPPAQILEIEQFEYLSTECCPKGKLP